VTRARLPERPKLLGFGTVRALWTVFLAVAPAGMAGLVVITASQFALLVGSHPRCRLTRR